MAQPYNDNKYDIMDVTANIMYTPFKNDLPQYKHT